MRFNQVKIWIALILLIVCTQLSAKKAYLASFDLGSNLHILDTGLLNLTLANSGEVFYSVALSPDERYVYGMSTSPNEMLVYDANFNTFSAAIPVTYFQQNSMIRSTLDGSKLFIGGIDGFSVFTGGPNPTLLQDVALPGKTIEGFCIAPNDTLPNSNFAVFTCINTNEVIIVDTDTYAIRNTIPVGTYPTDVAISINNDKAFVSNHDDDTITVLDLPSGTIADTISLDPNDEPVRIDASPDDRLLYVSCKSGNIKVFDIKTYALLNTIVLSGYTPFVTVFSLSENRAYTATFDPSWNGAVVVTNTQTLQEETQVSLGGFFTGYRDITIGFNPLPPKPPTPPPPPPPPPPTPTEKPPPPQDVSVNRMSNTFGLHKEYLDKLEWSASTDPFVNAYKIHVGSREILLDPLQIETRQFGRFKYEIPVLGKKQPAIYRISAVTQAGIESDQITVKVNGYK